MADTMTIPQARALISRMQRRDQDARTAEIREVLTTLAGIISESGRAIREIDPLIEWLCTEGASYPDAADTLAKAVAVRASALEHIRILNPDQAWFWTDEWQAGERAVDAEIAAGHLLGPFSDEEFTKHLESVIAEDAHA